MGQRWEHFVTAPKVTVCSPLSRLVTNPNLEGEAFFASLFSDGIFFFLVGALSEGKSEPHAVGWLL